MNITITPKESPRPKVTITKESIAKNARLEMLREKLTELANEAYALHNEGKSSKHLREAIAETHKALFEALGVAF